MSTGFARDACLSLFLITLLPVVKAVTGLPNEINIGLLSASAVGVALIILLVLTLICLYTRYRRLKREMHQQRTTNVYDAVRPGLRSDNSTYEGLGVSDSRPPLSSPSDIYVDTAPPPYVYTLPDDERQNYTNLRLPEGGQV